MSNTLQTVQFAGTDLFIINQAGTPFVPMRPIVEAMGMDWASQFTKLKTKFETSVAEITTQLPNDTQSRAVTCLPLAKIAGWLYSISPNKVAPEIREKVIQYQNECDTALFDYWTKGIATKPSDAATPEQKQHIKYLITLHTQRSNISYPTAWQRLFDAAGFNKLDNMTQTAYKRATKYFAVPPMPSPHEANIAQIPATPCVPYSALDFKPTLPRSITIADIVRHFDPSCSTGSGSVLKQLLDALNANGIRIAGAWGEYNALYRCAVDYNAHLKNSLAMIEANQNYRFYVD